MRTFSIFIALVFLASCASKDEQDVNTNEQQFYESAQRSLQSGNFVAAVEKLQQLEARFPFGRFAEQGQLEIIYAYYKSYQPESARAAADRFMRLHPTHPNVDYALYLRALASFEEDQSFFERFLPIDPSTRDPGAARDSFADFAQLIRRFPESQYAPDAQKRLIYLKNLLAASEVNVARYYIKREAFVAAANRGRYVFEHYQGTPSVPDALAIMVEAYTYMEMDDLANEALLVLATNFPDHATLDRNGKFRKSQSVKNSERSWINIITFGLAG